MLELLYPRQLLLTQLKILLLSIIYELVKNLTSRN